MKQKLDKKGIMIITMLHLRNVYCFQIIVNVPHLYDTLVSWFPEVTFSYYTAKSQWIHQNFQL